MNKFAVIKILKSLCGLFLGFSMGGALSLHTGYHLNRNLGGVFCLSSFLNDRSIVYESLENSSAESLPPLKMFHGGR